MQNVSVRVPKRVSFPTRSIQVTEKNWKRLVADIERMNKLAKYLADSWKEEGSREKLGNTTLVVKSVDQCFQITTEGVNEIDELRATQEEADTRIMLDARHADAKYSKVIVLSEDTDVL